MELLAARIGTTISYCHPYTPTQKAKIERWFRTMKDQWMASLDMRDFHTLDELRGSLQQFVRNYNQSVHSSLKGMSPQDRFFSEPELIKRLPEEQIERSFLLEIERRVSSDCVITIDQIEYEVDYRFAKQRITLRYTPDMNEIYVVEADGTLCPIHLLNKHDNASDFHAIQGEITRLALDKKKTPVIIIDEANYISNAVLNDLKILFNFEMDSRDRAVILLVGLPQLNHTLQLAIHEPLRQRIIMNYNIDGYTKDEGRAYIDSKLKGAGCNQDVFDDSAIEAILNASDGTARMISKLCNSALVIGKKVNFLF